MPLHDIWSDDTIVYSVTQPVPDATAAQQTEFFLVDRDGFTNFLPKPGAFVLQKFVGSSDRGFAVVGITYDLGIEYNDAEVWDNATGTYYLMPGAGDPNYEYYRVDPIPTTFLWKNGVWENHGFVATSMNSQGEMAGLRISRDEETSDELLLSSEAIVLRDGMTVSTGISPYFRTENIELSNWEESNNQIGRVDAVWLNIDDSGRVSAFAPSTPQEDGSYLSYLNHYDVSGLPGEGSLISLPLDGNSGNSIVLENNIVFNGITSNKKGTILGSDSYGIRTWLDPDSGRAIPSGARQVNEAGTIFSGSATSGLMRVWQFPDQDE